MQSWCVGEGVKVGGSVWCGSSGEVRSGWIWDIF